MARATDKREESKDWDEMSTGEKLEAMGCSSPEDCIELCSDLLDTINQIEDLLKMQPPLSEAKLRKMLLELVEEGEMTETP